MIFFKCYIILLSYLMILEITTVKGGQVGNPKIFNGVSTFVRKPYKGIVWYTPNRYNEIRINGSISGLPANEFISIEVHTYGRLTNNCTAVGPIWRAFPTTTSFLSPIGNLGILRVNNRGILKIQLMVPSFDLDLFNGFIGRSLVLVGTNGLPLCINDNEGLKIACSIIGYRSDY